MIGARARSPYGFAWPGVMGARNSTQQDEMDGRMQGIVEQRDMRIRHSLNGIPDGHRTRNYYEQHECCEQEEDAVWEKAVVICRVVIGCSREREVERERERTQAGV